MKIISSKSKLTGNVRIPGSKSHTIRAVAFASLAKGKSIIRKPLISLDTKSAIKAYQALGASIQEKSNEWIIKGFSAEPTVPDDIIDVGNSGTSLRLAIATAALLEKGFAIFTGDEQIRKRPSGPLLKSINELGAFAKSSRENDLPPFIVSGKLRGGITELQATSSQYLSALLVNCPFAEDDSQIVVPLLNEKPYVEMTLSWLDKLNVKYTNRNFEEFHINGGQKIDSFDVTIPADFSSATFFLCAAAITGENVQLKGLDLNDTQGDKAVVEYLREMGAKIEIRDNIINVNADKLTGIELDLNATPDALPALAVTACFADAKTILYNVPQARIKETDRIAVMAEELTKLGAKVNELPDGLEIFPSKIKGTVVDGHNDHRVIMALAIAGLASDEPVVVENAQAVSVTFPDFVDLMSSIGANMSLEN